MDTAAVMEIARQTLWITILVSAPLLGAALVVGVLVGVIQAAALALAVTGSWQIATIADFARSIFQRIPALFG